MDVNRAILDTREKLVNVLNQAGLPIEVLRLIILELQTIVENQSKTEKLIREQTAEKEASNNVSS